MRKEILKLKEEGKTYNEISNILGCSKGTISYHVGKRRSKEELEKLKEKQLNRECIYCGEKLPINDSKFCDKDCYVEYNRLKRIKNLEKGLLKTNTTIRLALIQKYKNKCFLCGQNNIWNNKSLILQVDHIDGNSDNNEESNLRLLCPNCHSQTETFTGGCKPKNTKRNKYLRQYKSPSSSG